MKVILLEKYKKLGEVGSVVEVKGGYARNFLIPGEKAVQATKENIADFEAKKADLVAQSKKKEDEANAVAIKLSDKIVTVLKQASDDGRLYGSVSTSEIADQATKIAGIEVSRKQVTLNTSIKFLGFYQVEVDLGEGVVANIFANISRTESEAKEAEGKFQKGKLDLGPLRNKAEEHHEPEEVAPIQDETSEELQENVSDEQEEELQEAKEA